jgi:hypothetical protein
MKIDVHLPLKVGIKLCMLIDAKLCVELKIKPHNEKE